MDVFRGAYIWLSHHQLQGKVNVYCSALLPILIAVSLLDMERIQ